MRRATVAASSIAFLAGFGIAGIGVFDTAAVHSSDSARDESEDPRVPVPPVVRAVPSPSTPRPCRVVAEGATGPDEAELRNTVLDLLQRRDEALVANDDEALLALSVAASPARAADEGLLAQLDGVSILQLETNLVQVRLIVSEPQCGPGAGSTLPYGAAEVDAVGAVAEVRTIQNLLVVSGEDAVGPLPERCARWHLVPGPWRLHEISECE